MLRFAQTEGKAVSINFDFIKNFLGPLEGAGVTRGYVPCDKAGRLLGVSGVTIGTGVDLGQQTGAGLLDMGVPHVVVKKLLPYIGLKKTAALAAIKAQPLVLTPAEVAAIDDAVFARYVRDIEARYNGDKPSVTFADIPPQAQAVIVSVLYQRGLGSPKNFPNTWKLLLAGDWPGAAAELCNGALWDGYQTRRAAEGQILRGIEPDKTRQNAKKQEK